MTHTTYDPLVAMTYPLALSHAPKADGSLAVEHRTAHNTVGHPSGFLYSTVLDRTNFAQLHLQAWRFRNTEALTPASVAVMHTPQVNLYTVHDESYGLTFRTKRYKGIRLLRHHGLLMCYSSIFYLAPDHEIGIAILFNSIAAPVGAEALAKSILGDLLALPDESIGPAVAGFTSEPLAFQEAPAWAQLTGEYLGLNAGLAPVSIVDGRLTLDLNGVAIPLRQNAPQVYVGYSPPSGALVSIGFVPVSDTDLSETERIRYVLVNGSLFERFVRDLSHKPDPTILASYAGVYVGETGTLVVSNEQDVLVIRSPEDDTDARCLALDATTFVGPLGLIAFVVDDAGGVQGLRQGRFYSFRRVAE